MLNKIVDGISEKLYIVFNSQSPENKYNIYTESVKQGLEMPCFFIQLIDSVSLHEIGNRYFRDYLFCIQYFPKNKDEPKAECSQMQDYLYLALEYITVDGDLQRGVKMRGELIDGVLNFFVNFNMHVILTEETELMEHLETSNTKMKG